jgi:lipopolysaccharide transport protein LptA
MSSTNQNRRILYEGKAVLWQAGNRLQAHRVVIDRASQNLQAEGNVVSQFLDQRPSNKKTGRNEMAYTTIRAGSLDYNDKEKLAWYRGGVRLVRDAMDVKSRELRAWLKADAADGDSKLDRAFADGAVEIFQADGGRTRKGTSEHAEYYVSESKVILTGGEPTLVDSQKGNTRGKKLTYWANDDSLQVEGEAGKPAVSNIRRK